MKKTYKIIGLATAALLMLLQGCKSEKIEFTPTDGLSGEAVGYLDISAFDLQVADYAEEITSSENDPALTGSRTTATKTDGNFNSTTEADGDYVIRIRNISTGDEKEYTYAELEQIENGQVSLTPGRYVVSAESPEYESYMTTGNAAEWDAPVYYGETSATIVSKKETEVSGIVCRLANIKATVSLTPDLANLFMSDNDCEHQEGAKKLSVTLSAGDNSLEYTRADMDAIRTGYFKVDKGSSQTIDVLLSGMYNTAPADADPVYTEINWKSTLPDCKAGQWRKISIGLTNASEGNVSFEITVENWTYGETVDVDVTKMYTFAEEIIDDEASDENSPVLSLEGGDIADGYTIHAGMFDTVLSKWTDNLRLSLVPSDGAKVETVTVEVTGSDNQDFLSAVDALGVRNRTIEVYPDASVLSGNLVVSDSEDAGALSFVLNDAGMTRLYRYKGEHHFKVTAVDDRYKFSYTDLTITCLEGEVVIGGPEIVWTNSDGTVTYDFDQVYTIDESLQVKINVSTESTFTGFNVVIEGDILSDEILGIVGLTRNLDLINPGDAESMLRDLGFPTGTDVTSKTEIGFDISGFLTMIEGVAGAGITECGFRLIVTDAHGTTEKTVQLRVQK